ncbi:hypothetical protein DPX16_6918 [Anabarilius grahami]|uniref:Uncharacterized protein n=1 Tax=Anabarilius grahami TaxID=495550 RepID=A0A3N0Y6Q0_ANAGA|nr:hypothetical protein DPX16_6918 [Anabarilius grahami]
MLNRRRSVGPSDHSVWLFSYCHLLVRKGISSYACRRRTDVLLGRRLSSVGLVCQGTFGYRRCRREPTLQSAFVATSSSVSAWLSCPCASKNVIREEMLLQEGGEVILIKDYKGT